MQNSENMDTYLLVIGKGLMYVDNTINEDFKKLSNEEIVYASGPIMAPYDREDMEERRKDWVPLYFKDENILEVDRLKSDAARLILEFSPIPTPQQFFDGFFLLSDGTPDREISTILSKLDLPNSFHIYRSRVVDEVRLNSVLESLKQKYPYIFTLYRAKISQRRLSDDELHLQELKNIFGF